MTDRGEISRLQTEKVLCELGIKTSGREIKKYREK